MLKVLKNFPTCAGVYTVRDGKKIYVGSTSNIKRRLTTHASQLNNGTHPNSAMQEAFNDHPDRFYFGIPERMPGATRDELFREELRVYSKYTEDKLFNLVPPPVFLSDSQVTEKRRWDASWARWHLKESYNLLLASEQSIKKCSASAYSGDPEANSSLTFMDLIDSFIEEKQQENKTNQKENKNGTL